MLDSLKHAEVLRRYSESVGEGKEILGSQGGQTVACKETEVTWLGGRSMWNIEGG